MNPKINKSYKLREEKLWEDSTADSEAISVQEKSIKQPAQNVRRNVQFRSNQLKEETYSAKTAMPSEGQQDSNTC